MARRTIFVLLVLVAFIGVSCNAPQGEIVVPPPTPAGANVVTITGYVKDCVTQKPLSGAEIKLEYQEGGLLFTYTDNEGFFEIKAPLGQVTITVSKPGYIRQSFYADLDTPGGTLRLTARLCPEE
ncbi:MAG: carboxypeptidase regulatory-like domain-containing protein [Candidatus Atribacteria bacterium]|nr:carboxypeptidase regulatory-like domain-containing protein [Candidatus Atribacteria bacterium]